MQNIKYVIFSAEQMRMRMDVESKLGRSYKPGLVLVNGIYKQYTDIIDNPSNTRYPDAEVIASGDIDNMIIQKGR
ncbi:MAG: hypothetical protein ACRCXT_06185 [Paraclostridium sp.]